MKGHLGEWGELVYLLAFESEMTHLASIFHTFFTQIFSANLAMKNSDTQPYSFMTHLF